MLRYLFVVPVLALAAIGLLTSALTWILPTAALFFVVAFVGLSISDWRKTRRIDALPNVIAAAFSAISSAGIGPGLVTVAMWTTKSYATFQQSPATVTLGVTLISIVGTLLFFFRLYFRAMYGATEVLSALGTVSKLLLQLWSKPARSLLDLS